MKSYISRKFPLETRTTELIADVRFATLTGTILTAALRGVEDLREAAITAGPVRAPV
jgi:hypothetical protein